MNSKLVMAGLMLALSGGLHAAPVADDVGALLETAAQQRREGNLRLAIESLEKACKRSDAPCDARVLGELGAAYYQAHRYAQAADALSEAYARADSTSERALFANDLGNLSASRGRRDEAVRYYEEARAKAGGNAPIAVSAGLNLARLAPPQERLARLQALAVEIAGIADTHERARYALNLGAQARTLGPAALKLSYEQLDRARTTARQLNDRWLLADSPDSGTYTKPVKVLSGGGGLISSTPDYLRFMQMLLNEGELDGVRILKRKTVAAMLRNQLPGEAVPINTSANDPIRLVGFGLGIAVVVDVENLSLGPAGTAGWGGYANTFFFVDPRDDMFAIFMVQTPSQRGRIQSGLKALIYQALGTER